jgi:TP901 family phage tail tape measure protein
MDVGNLRIVIGADVGGLRAGLRESERGLQNVAKSAKRIGSDITDVGVSLGMLAAPFVGFGAAAIAASIEFESAFANVEKTVDGSEAELATLRDTLRSMATGDTPLASLDNALLTLTGIAQIGGSLGIPLADLEQFTGTVALLDAASDDLDAEAAGNFIGQFMNVTGLPIDDISKLADAVVAIGNGMATTEGEVATFATRLAPLATYKWEPDKILAYSGALASLGMSPELGGSNVLKTVMDLTDAVALGGPKLEAFAIAAGLTADEFKTLATADPEGAFRAFIEGLSNMSADKQLGVLRDIGITSGEQVTTLQRLAGGYDQVTLAIGLAGDAFIKGGDALEEARKKADTTEGAINELKNRFGDLMISVGDKLTGGLANVATQLSPIVDSIKKWVDENPELVTQIALVAGGVGVLAVALTGAGLVFGAIGTVVGGLTVIFGGFATAVGLALSPLGLLAGAIGILAVTVTTLLPGIVESWGAAFEQIGIFIQNVIDQVGALLTKIGEVVAAIPGMQMSSGDSNRQSFQGLWDAHGAGADGTHATGLANVPFDGYRAILHKGERVMTAHENRSGGSGSVMINFNGGNFLGSRQEVIEWVREGMAEAGL